MKHLFTLLAIMLMPLASYGYDNESFTVKTGDDGLEMTFSVISEESKTVRTGVNYNTCIDWNYEGDVTVPSKVTKNGVKYTVTEIGPYSLSNCKLKSLTLPNTIESISRYSIMCNKNLESLTIPESVSRIEEGGITMNYLKSISVAKGNKYFTTIDNVLFNIDKTILIQYANNLPNTSYKIPDGTKRIANHAFDLCYLTDVEIPTTVTEIGDQAFYQCFRMKKVYIPASVTSIGEGAFTGGHHYLTSIEVDPKNPAYTTVDGVLYTNDKYKVVCYPTANDRISYDIRTGTIEILGHSFSGADNLQSVTIPTTVEKIGTYAFGGCDGLQSVDIPANVTYIANQAFDYCRNLTKVVFHSPVPPETPSYSTTIFGGNENITLYVPYTGIDAYSKNQSLTKVHIDPAIDWHDNHWYFVFSCVKGIDFTQSDGITAYKIVENPNISGASPASKVISTRASNDSPVMLVPVDKAGPNDCVLLYAEPGSTYTLHSDDTAPHITDNLLQSVEKDEMISSKDGEKSNFVFNGTDFVLVEGNDNVSFGTGYLQIPTSKIPEGMTNLAIESIPNATTGIAGIKAVPSKQNVYNLKGVPVNSTNNKVFKVNGKNVIVLD